MTASERTAQIADVAVALFGRRGFRGATTKAIARAAGVSEATIFKYFPTKADLYVTAFQRRTGEGTSQLVTGLQAFADRNDDEGLLRTLVAAILFGYERDRDLHRMMAYAWLEQGQAANRQMWERVRAPLFGFLRRYVTQRQAAGAFRPGDPGLVAFTMMALPAHYAGFTKLYDVDLGFSDAVVVETLSRLLLSSSERVVPPVDVALRGPGRRPPAR